MAVVIYLKRGEDMPDEGEEIRWLLIHPSGDGRFFGSGGSWKQSEEWVGYGSLSKDDVSFEKALKAAQNWATKYDVPMIWVATE